MQDERESFIVDCLLTAFADLMEADPDAFRTKFRKMAADPFAFYRGSACVFYADVAGRDDRWADERTSGVWIQGDLHTENFGTYMDGEGKLIFDVNDFDEAYIGHFTWDLMRFAASVALMCWQKALSDHQISTLIDTFVRSYVDQVRWFLDADDDSSFSLNLDTARGAVLSTLQSARLSTRAEMLDRLTAVDDWDRRFRDAAGVRRLEDAEREKVEAAFATYLDTIPKTKRFQGITYDIKDVIGKTGHGIGSAGLPTYTLLIEGFNQALDNDAVLSMKQGNVAAPSRVVDHSSLGKHFKHHGHRTAVSQRALQAHADPLLGYTDIDGVGFVVSEISPYEADLDWSELTEPDELAEVIEQLGRAVAKVHCVGDVDSDQKVVEFQTEEAIVAAISGRVDEFASDMVKFGLEYAATVRDDHRHFVEAFREGRIPKVSST
ncbi:DUF2252 domain-containing protein [Mycolicibacterium celeriflavum]|uniref:Uncharacterized protein n=1 Tax=Mycolicibacterium celeriflavum TaxID=1249101 RepID=A0A1X0BQE3_MYCCF|nr:DUF2252 domain-containing protein [Mycolicibacterium celeriflavum]MCV7237877.1 DUF2252 domain-containing protein [Mycolicibacterium celeriflavum]ORA45581.1 hypothetical protein BST21_17025 [Mycolicibacterium celeriflavum]BBY43712.1 hypothetical protein MCEL_20070 [Mycolicibacterium celeriflavum]